MRVFQPIRHPSSSETPLLLIDLLKSQQELASHFAEERIVHFSVDRRVLDFLATKRKKNGGVVNLKTEKFIDVVYNAVENNAYLLLGAQRDTHHWLTFRSAIRNQTIALDDQQWRLQRSWLDASPEHLGIHWYDNPSDISATIRSLFQTPPPSKCSLFEICAPCAGYRTTRYYLSPHLWIDLSSWVDFGVFGCYAVGGCRLSPDSKGKADFLLMPDFDEEEIRQIWTSWESFPALNTLTLSAIRGLGLSLCPEALFPKQCSVGSCIAQMFPLAEVHPVLPSDSSFYALHPHNEEDMRFTDDEASDDSSDE